MAKWAKIKFFYSSAPGTVGTTLTVTTTATGDYDVAYLYNMLETNMWKAADTNNQHITLDMGSGFAGVPQSNPDFLAIAGHNLGSVQPLIVLEYSTTGAWAGEEAAAFAPYINTDTANKAFIKEFAAVGAKRYWRLRLYGGPFGTALFMATCIWGNKTELDYATASFDPYAQTAKASVNITQGGYMAGTHTKHIERQFTLNFADADSILYSKVKAWWEASGLKNFFVAWETANSPADVYLMRSDGGFNNPLINGGAYRGISINLKGRKE